MQRTTLGGFCGIAIATHHHENRIHQSRCTSILDHGCVRSQRYQIAGLDGRHSVESPNEGAERCETVTCKFLVPSSTLFSLLCSMALLESFVAHLLSCACTHSARGTKESTLEEPLPPHRHCHPCSRSSVSVGSLAVRGLFTSVKKVSVVMPTVSSLLL